jgi:hypothetical protein
MSQQSNNWRTVSAVLIGTVIVLALVVGIMYYNSTISASGIIYIKAVSCAVYFDNAGTQSVTAINWGSLPPDSAVNQTIYLKNTGNTACNFTVSTSNFSPSNAGTWISLTYDLKGAINVPANSIVPCVLTESISANITGISSYSYSVTVTASG